MYEPLDACEVCGATRELHTDHDHETGLIRGTLCGSCNRALGLFHDNPAVLREAARYLERPPTEHTYRDHKRRLQSLADAKRYPTEAERTKRRERYLRNKEG